MRSRLELAQHILEHGFKVLDDNIATLTRGEAWEEGEEVEENHICTLGHRVRPP